MDADRLSDHASLVKAICSSALVMAFLYSDTIEFFRLIWLNLKIGKALPAPGAPEAAGGTERCGLPRHSVPALGRKGQIHPGGCYLMTHTGGRLPWVMASDRQRVRPSANPLSTGSNPLSATKDKRPFSQTATPRRFQQPAGARLFGPAVGRPQYAASGVPPSNLEWKPPLVVLLDAKRRKGLFGIDTQGAVHWMRPASSTSTRDETGRRSGWPVCCLRRVMPPNAARRTCP